MRPLYYLPVLLLLTLYLGLEAGFRIGQTHEANTHGLAIARMTGTSLHQIETGGR